MKTKFKYVLLYIIIIQVGIIYGQNHNLDDNFFDNATQYNSNEGVFQNDVDTVLSEKNVIHTTSIAEKKVSNVTPRKKSIGLSFSDIANKTVKEKKPVIASKPKSDNTRVSSPKKAFGLSFTQMANFTVDPKVPTKNKD